MGKLISPQIGGAVLHRLQAIGARRGAMGMQYLVLRDAGVWLEHCHGLADAASAQPVTPRTTFNAYSITKPLTAAAVIALANKGLVDLDAPIGTAAGVEGLGAYGSVRETLLHRAGFRNPNPLRWIHRYEAHNSFDEAAFIEKQIDALRRTHRRLSRTGYSNVGYLLLGLVIERACGASFTQAMHDLVFKQLELGHDERLGFAIGAPELHARGHIKRCSPTNAILGLLIERSAIVDDVAGGWVRLGLHHVNGTAYGGLIANARGLARFGCAVLGSGRAQSKAANQNLDIVPGPGPCRSLGWFSGKITLHRYLEHAGGGLGYYGELRLYPALRAVSCLLTNGSGFKDDRCLDHIDAAWLATA